jgi:uncharacterized protein YuzE
MKVNFDPSADAMRISFQEGDYEESKEVDEGIVVDISRDNKIMAIEILDVSEKMSDKALKDISLKG